MAQLAKKRVDESVEGLWSLEGWAVASVSGPLETLQQHCVRHWLVSPFDDVRVKYLHMKDAVRLPTAEPLSRLRFPSSFGRKMSFPVPTFIIHNFKDQMGIFFSFSCSLSLNTPHFKSAG